MSYGEKKTNNTKQSRNPRKYFQGEELIAECPSIQAAARFLKKETNSKQFNWSAINNEIWYGESYSKDGATYFFTTDKEAIKKKTGYDLV
ncbi:hypothetical protein SAMD00020551_0995 [Mesobacillus selenatarsenatis SF-1]|uniref:Uncharacterized protein n=1 Tax=Mesobacillus selenatarsenatis (strain DSM 18680 / JCM 14380 / FERM P-15431 / SF-1) TaxID=1321606 RepID=A0A0A8WYS7_MESS1|nr:hypothetical protein SAMD00020551_0995 [Mesobacillus selenatarsenatis SF-1]